MLNCCDCSSDGYFDPEMCNFNDFLHDTVDLVALHVVLA